MKISRLTLVKAFALAWICMVLVSAVLAILGVFEASSSGNTDAFLVAGIVLASLTVLLTGLGIAVYATFRIRQLSSTRDQFRANHAKTGHIAASVGRLRIDVSELVTNQNSLKSQMGEISNRTKQIRAHTEREAQVSRIKSGRNIGWSELPRAQLMPASQRVVTANPGNTVGRNAAAFNGDNNIGTNLARLICPDPPSGAADNNSLIPIADGVVSNRLASVFQDNRLNFQQLVPQIAGAQRRPAAAFFIIEDSAFEMGPWSGALQTQSTSLYKEIRRLLQDAKKDGSALVYAATTRRVSHYIQEVKAMCDLVVEHGECDISWAPDARLPFVEQVAEHQVDWRA